MNSLIDSFLFEGIDQALAQHIAHLFIRDPVILLEHHLTLDDMKAADHFEVIIEFSFLKLFD